MQLKTFLKKSSQVLIVSFCFSCVSEEKVKLEQYLITGAELYQTHCANCHGNKGEGLRDLYPPLKNADYLQNQSDVICAIKNGLSGKIVVNGKEYDGVMPKNKDLYPLDIAQIVTFINEEFGEKKNKIVETDLVKSTVCAN